MLEVGSVCTEVKGGEEGALSVVCTLPTSSILPPLSLIDNDIFSIFRKVLKGWKITLGWVPYCLFNHIACTFLCENSGALADPSLKCVVRYGCHKAKLNCNVGSAEKWRSWLQKSLGPKMPLHLNACRKTWINSKVNNFWELKTSHSLP